MSDFSNGIRREMHRMGSRKAYLFGMVLVPVFICFFFLSLLSEGLPLKVPSAVVDLDHTPLSREVTRALNATELIDIRTDAESYDKALEAVRRGEVFGFFVIPANFESDALAMRTPTLEYYSNMTFFVPGTLAFKGFKSIAVTTSGGVIKATLQNLGVDGPQVGALLQPVAVQNHGIGNPWMNYSIYLTPSFTIAAFALMIMLMTVFSITMEIKNGTSRQWLESCGGRLSTALLTKMLPHTAVYVAVGLFIFWMMFGLHNVPMNGSLAAFLFGMVLFIIASQSFALFITSLLPNPRLAFSICALFGILTFSFAGFSFPVQSMYGAIGIFSWLAPTRYMFLIYICEALNGYSAWYVRWWYVILALFPLGAALMSLRLRKALLNPVYVP